MNSSPQLPMAAPKLITEGHWGDIAWQFLVDPTPPDVNLCTAAFCIVTFKGSLVLVDQKQRGFELAGGHSDPNEPLDVTVKREVLEEVGAVITQPHYFGYKKVLPVSPIPHRDKANEYYPFPVSYIPYFFAEAESLLDNPLAPDVKGRRLASLREARDLLSPGHHHEKIIEYLDDIGAIIVRHD
jgi:8-oxo-dGTP pyrophosphatase MutT (NUDIX family)